MATKLDLQRAMWAVHFHRHFHPDARPVPPDFWDRLKPISLAEAVDILWNDAEAKRSEAKERTKDAEGVTPASLMALMRLYTAYELRGLYPKVFLPRFPDGHLPDDLSGVFPVDREKVRELYARRAPLRSPMGMQQPVASDLPDQLNREKVQELYALTAMPGSPTSITQPMSTGLTTLLTIPDYTSLSDVPQGPLDQLPCPEPGFRLLEQPNWDVFFPVQNYVLDITDHAATGWLSVIWSIDVERPFSDMLKSLDPRNWEICSTSVQVATEALKSDPCPLGDPGRPANEGTSWQNYFWEKLGVNGDQTLALCNQLYFTFNVSAQAIITTFSDKDPAGNKTTLDPLIEFDRGWAAYGPAPWDGTGAWTRLRVVKYLKFTSGWVADLGVLLLRNWADDEVTSEVACIIT
jgi:hypothetical protein